MPNVHSVMLGFESQLRDLVTGFTAEHEALDAECRALEGKNGYLQREVNLLRQKLGREISRTAELQSEIGSLRTQLEDETSHTAELESEVDALREQLDSDQAEARRLRADRNHHRDVEGQRLRRERDAALSEAGILRSQAALFREKCLRFAGLFRALRPLGITVVYEYPSGRRWHADDCGNCRPDHFTSTPVFIQHTTWSECACKGYVLLL